MHKRTHSLIILILIVAALPSVLTAPALAQEPGSKGSPIVIGTVRFFGFLPAYKIPEILAKDGLFAVNVEFPSATERLEAVAAGYTHFSYAGLTASTILRTKGKSIVVLSSTNDKGRALMAKPELKSVADLKGKTVAVTYGSIEHMSLLAELVKAGLDPKRDVKILNMPAYDQPIAYNSGSIDAFMAFEPWAQFGLKKFGAKLLTYPYDNPLGTIDSGIESTEEFVAKYPAMTKAVIKAHVQAVQWYRQNPEEIIKSGVERYKVPEEVMRAAMDNVALSYDIKVDNLKALAKFLKELGYIDREPEWEKFVNTRFLEEARKELGIQ
jgi:NitT/TauT family transport system substrate-binding protein